MVLVQADVGDAFRADGVAGRVEAADGVGVVQLYLEDLEVPVETRRGAWCRPSWRPLRTGVSRVRRRS